MQRKMESPRQSESDQHLRRNPNLGLGHAIYANAPQSFWHLTAVCLYLFLYVYLTDLGIAYCPPCTKKVASGEVTAPTPSTTTQTPTTPITQTASTTTTQSAAVSTTTASATTDPSTTPVAPPSAPPPAAARAPAKPKAKKPRKPATAGTSSFSTPVMPTQYTGAGRPPPPNYYAAWHSHYAYYGSPYAAAPGTAGSYPPGARPVYSSTYSQIGQAAVQQVYPTGVIPMSQPAPPPTSTPAATNTTGGPSSSGTKVSKASEPAEQKQD